VLTLIYLRKLFKNKEDCDNSIITDDDKFFDSHKCRNNNLARVHAQMAACYAAKAIPTPVPFTHNPTPAPPCELILPPPPPAPQLKPKPAVPACAESHVPSD
jgi:hypothetical protein